MRAKWGVLALPALACATQGQTTPERLLKEIGSRGASAVVGDLWQDPKRWDGVMAGISSGSAEWLAVAVALEPGTDAGATSELTVALFLALEPAPERMLRLFNTSAKASSDGEESLLGPRWVCGSDVYVDYAPDEARRLIDARITAVERVSAPELTSMREACVRGLEEARALDIR